MSRLTKIIYFGVLAIVSAVQVLGGNPQLAAALFILIIFALPLYEKREAQRQFYRTLRKLYICVDLDAFRKEIENLEKHALIKRAVMPALEVLMRIEDYYKGNRDDLVYELGRLKKVDAYAFWRDCYIGLCDVTQIECSQLRRALIRVPRHYRKIATERFEVLELMQKIQSDDTVDTREIEALRERVTTNLLIAELTKCLRDHTQVDRIRKYYDQATINLSKGLEI